jgi:hypothetical protein
VLSVVCPPTGVVMFAPSVIPRNAQRAKSEGRAKELPKSAAKDSIKAGARKPRPMSGAGGAERVGKPLAARALCPPHRG